MLRIGCFISLSVLGCGLIALAQLFRSIYFRLNSPRDTTTRSSPLGRAPCPHVGPCSWLTWIPRQLILVQRC
jgi:hypothetical protein